MYKVLIVDDSPVDRRLVLGLLRNDPELQLQGVGDAEQAMLLATEWRPDLVITDWLLPKINGLKLLRKIRKKHPEIPVILMTSHGDERMVIEALERGAASYVPKSQLSERIQSTVAQVLGRVGAKSRHQRLMGCVSELDVTWHLDPDPALIPSLVSYLRQQIAGLAFCDRVGQVRMAIALEEVLRNAIYHGSLELGSDVVSGRSGQLDALVKARRAEAPYRDRRVTVRVHMSVDGARFVIRDEGPGFSAFAHSDESTSEPNVESPGRGLTLVRAFMDEVTFNERGNEVTLVKLPDRVHRNVAAAISMRQLAEMREPDLLIGMLEECSAPARTTANTNHS